MFINKQLLAFSVLITNLFFHSIAFPNVELFDTDPLKITAEDTAQFEDSFGNGVDVDGNWMAVSADDYDPSLDKEDAGAVYLYYRDNINDDWQLVEQLLGDDPYGQFGYTVAIDNNRLAVGAPSYGDSGKGAFFIYNLGYIDDEAVVSLEKSHILNNYSKFGASLQLDGEVLVVGAPYRKIGPNMNMGSVYIYYQNKGGDNNWALRKFFF